jgi:hypothetical protein
MVKVKNLQKHFVEHTHWSRCRDERIDVVLEYLSNSKVLHNDVSITIFLSNFSILDSTLLIYSSAIMVNHAIKSL